MPSPLLLGPGAGHLACSPPICLPNCSIYDGQPTTVASLMALPDKPSLETTLLWATAVNLALVFLRNDKRLCLISQLHDHESSKVCSRR